MKLSEKFLEENRSDQFFNDGYYTMVDYHLSEDAAIKYGQLCAIEGKIEFLSDNIERLRVVAEPSNNRNVGFAYAIKVRFIEVRAELEKQLNDLYNE